MARITDIHRMAWTATFCALAAGYAAAWLARWAAPRLGCVDRPDGGRKRHQRPTPLLGGVAVTAAFVVVANGLFHADPTWQGLSLSAILLCALGVWDDRFGMNARIKFIGQAASLCALPLDGGRRLGAG